MHEAVVTRTSIKLRNSFLLHIHWKEFLSFIPWVSHAVMIQQRSRNRCDTGSIQKAGKSRFSPQLSGYTQKLQFRC